MLIWFLQWLFWSNFDFGLKILNKCLVQKLEKQSFDIAALRKQFEKFIIRNIWYVAFYRFVKRSYQF